MTSLSSYILSIGAAGLLCALTEILCASNGATGRTTKLIAGLFLLLAILKPMLNIRIQDLAHDWERYADQAQTAVELGENHSALALQNGIKERIASYILDIGADHGVHLTVQVLLDDAAVPNLHGLILQGDVAPYTKQVLSNAFCRELGLEEEDILWQ